jgi:hypothetical protein
MNRTETVENVRENGQECWTPRKVHAKCDQHSETFEKSKP